MRAWPGRPRSGIALRVALLLALSLALSLVVSGRAVQAQTFLPDDPLRVDPDRMDLPDAGLPAERVRSELYDFLVNTFGSPGLRPGPALNVNTLGEVPNSSWYTNRHYRTRLSREALARGPNRGAGPARDGAWKVVDRKTDGKTVGLRIEDARGDRYVLKFDPAGYPELSTGAERVVTAFLYALGYHVPENYVVRFRADRLTPGLESGLTEEDLRATLARVPRYPDGSYRALASRLLPGAPIGPFRYYGTRVDDPNDIFPHERRRELRGLRVFAAWLNHYDARSQNTLDMVVEEGGRRYVRHHLLDFGTTLGGSPLGPLHRWAGFRYAFDPVQTLGRLLPFVPAAPDGRAIAYPALTAVGHFEADHFDPRAWVPQYPNPAFRQMDLRDAFWAARQVMHFTDAEIRAVVEAGVYTDPAAVRALTDLLVARRDRIGAAFLALGGGLDRFRVEGGRLAFDDLPAAHGRPGARARRVTWRIFDNQRGVPGPRLTRLTTPATRLRVPATAAPFLRAEIVTEAQGLTRVYLRRDGEGYAVVGVERCPPQDACSVLEARQAQRAALFEDRAGRRGVSTGR